MKVAYVHDWLDTYRGGERVLEALLSLYPEAPIFTLFYQPDALPTSITSRKIIFPKTLAPLRRYRKMLLPLLPLYAESFDLSSFDLIISSSSCVAKGIIPAPHAKHLCYIHSPMRYLWDMREHYEPSWAKLPLLSLIWQTIASRLRLWDTATSVRVDQFISNSTFVHKRVQRFYGRTSNVIHPPIDTERFNCADKKLQTDSYFLVAGAFVRYKRFDLAILAAEIAGKKLIVAGSGADEKYLRQLAGKHCSFVIAPSDQKWLELLQGATALLFPGIEDFGMVAVEALASGTPMIAYAGGGAMDFVRVGETGEFFYKATPESLATALEQFNAKLYDPQKLSTFAKTFSRDAFLNKMRVQIGELTA